MYIFNEVWASVTSWSAPANSQFNRMPIFSKPDLSNFTFVNKTYNIRNTLSVNANTKLVISPSPMLRKVSYYSKYFIGGISIQRAGTITVRLNGVNSGSSA